MPRLPSLQRKTPLTRISRFWLVASMTLVLSACEQNSVQPKIAQGTTAEQKTLPTQVAVKATELTTEQQIAARQVFSPRTLEDSPSVDVTPEIQLTLAKPAVEQSPPTKQADVIRFSSEDISEIEPTIESEQQDTAAQLLAKPYAELGLPEQLVVETTKTPVVTEFTDATNTLPQAAAIDLEQVVVIEPALPVEPVQPPPILDLWQITANHFSLPDIDETAAIASRIAPYDARYRKRTDYMQKVTARSSRYYHYVLSEVLEAGLPGELALLPFIESGFDTFAYSHGRAAGAWQFIPSTGRMFGLKQTWWYDGRRDIVASTGAAIKYLSQLHKRFDNDWYLAIAAYNGGPGTVSKAIKANKKLGKATDYWSLSLPKETMHYVPKLLGFSQVIYDHAGTDKLTTVANESHFEIVGIASQIDLALAAELADISIEELYRYNSGFNQFATDPDGPHQLVLPIEKAAAFSAKIDALPATKRIQWRRITIKQGDSLLGLAKRHNISVDAIRSLNNIRGNVIVAGKPLLIPTASKDAQAYSLSAAQRVLLHQQKQSQKNASNRIEHKVKSGESLWLIAKQYKVTVNQIVAWNKIGLRAPLQIGQKLNVWPRVPSTKLSDGSRQVVKKLTYKVRSGDNLSKIAWRFNVSINDIKRWNDDLKKYIQPGQKLTLYIDVTKSRS